MIFGLFLLSALPTLVTDRTPPAQLKDVVKAVTPGVRSRANRASATAAPWIDANGWRILRNPGKAVLYEVPSQAAALSAAEAFAHGAVATVRITSGDARGFSKMLALLKTINQDSLPPMTNFAVVDDGSPLMGEVMNLMSRKNLLYRPVRKAGSGAEVTVQRSAAMNPETITADARYKLTDEKRLVRIYGSNVVLAVLTGDASRARLFLLNYSPRAVPGVHVRVLGRYASCTVNKVLLAEASRDGDALEFTIPEIETLAVIDLR